MHPILFKLGPLTIYTYGFFVFLGVLSAYCYVLLQAKALGIGKDRVSDIFFWSLLSGFLGARLLYILVEFNLFLADPLGILFSRAGFVFFGGILAGIGAFYISSRIYNLDFWRVGDVLAVSIPLAHAFGRLGCFFYGCCWGVPSHSHLAVTFPHDSPAGWAGVPVLPTQLFSSAGLFLIFIFLLFVKKRKKFDGQLVSLYLIVYGSFRFFIEFLRGDPRGFIGFLSVSQVIALGAIVLGLFLYGFSRRRSTLITVHNKV